MAETWKEINELSSEVDLDQLVLTLNRYGIDHKISRQNDQTRLWVSADTDDHLVLDIVRKIEQLSRLEQRSPLKIIPKNIIVKAYFLRLPVTLITLVMGLAGTGLVNFYPDLIPLFTFQKFNLVGQGIEFEPVQQALARSEWWRLITPTFLHFGLFHIVFNALWLWEFGRRIELLVGSGPYFVVITALIIGANVGQFLWGGSAVFGGLSGVVYGLLGYIWIRNYRIPHPLLGLPNAIVPVMLLWLVICLLGVVDLMIPGGVANGAHVSGLIIGMLFGATSGRVVNIIK